MYIQNGHKISSIAFSQIVIFGLKIYHLATLIAVFTQLFQSLSKCPESFLLIGNRVKSKRRKREEEVGKF
jgi:hypothetical protein